eukprot:scaffold5708_cov107-Isochrysis_galbana.AAC.19
MSIMSLFYLLGGACLSAFFGGARSRLQPPSPAAYSPDNITSRARAAEPRAREEPIERRERERERGDVVVSHNNTITQAHKNTRTHTLRRPTHSAGVEQPRRWCATKGPRTSGSRLRL